MPHFTKYLARAAASIGVDGLFFETHPSPEKALSDASTQIPLESFEAILEDVLQFSSLAGRLE
jgi:2-dehydro-3-deoxyphosphooctonate aldolase (KDO 8-P synthase)